WLTDASERGLLETLGAFRQPEALTGPQQALLRVLEREGRIEALSVEDWEERERLRREEELRQAEEEAWAIEEARRRAEAE
ncbi:hypothetical protein, partial [Corallococcus carmarthensis]